MELLGVLVGARAIKFLHQEICVMITATHLWSDSTIVLHQIADEEKIKDIWVENRLLEIRQVRDTHNVQFRHVPTADNPADIVSRGMAASELQNCSKWWFGPTVLSQEATLWPSGPSSLTERTNSVPPPNSDLDMYGCSSFAALYVEAFTPEKRIPKRKLRSRKNPNPLDTITANEDKYPQWTRQVRITYYVLRFAAAYLRRIRERLRQERLRQGKKVAFKHVFTPSLGFDLADHFVSPRPNLRDLNITELIMLSKTQLRHRLRQPIAGIWVSSNTKDCFTSKDVSAT
ncbi:Pao retrotransposon peptidase family protein [Aphelenchoides avenae]|nr:Pao retrotransposon peptidase family protein [Aphelenchus avenae]